MNENSGKFSIAWKKSEVRGISCMCVEVFNGLCLQSVDSSQENQWNHTLVLLWCGETKKYKSSKAKAQFIIVGKARLDKVPGIRVCSGGDKLLDGFEVPCLQKRRRPGAAKTFPFPSLPFSYNLTLWSERENEETSWIKSDSLTSSPC